MRRLKIKHNNQSTHLIRTEEEALVPNRDLLFFLRFSVIVVSWLWLLVGIGGEVAIMSLVLPTYVADISTT